MRLSFYTEFGAPPMVRDATWAEVVEMLSMVEHTECSHNAEGDKPSKACEHKYGSAWSPVAMTDKRNNANVTAVTMLVLDLDHLTAEEVAAVAVKLDGYRYLAHSTHSHHYPDDCCVRVVMPLTRDVHPLEWPSFFSTAKKVLDVPADPTIKPTDKARLFFLPRIPKGVDFLLETNEGALLDVDAILRQADGLKEKPAAPPSAAPFNPEAPPDVGDVREHLSKRASTLARARDADAGEKKEVAAAIRRILAGAQYAASPEDTNAPAELPRGRDMVSNQVFSAMAFAVPFGTPFELLEPVVRPSIGAMSSDAEKDSVADWIAETKDMYERAMRRRGGMLEEEAQARGRVAASLDTMLSSMRANPTISPTPRAPSDTPESTEDSTDDAPSDEGEEDEKWEPFLSKDDKGNIEATQLNAVVLLTKHPHLIGSVVWDDVQREVVGRGIFESFPDHRTLITAVGCWFEGRLQVSFPSFIVKEAIYYVARANPIDPLRDYLLALEWDGTARADMWLEQYCRAEVVNEDGEDITDIVRSFARKWLVSAVARALEPGCQADSVLILEGAQGIRKSTVVRVLGEPWTAGDKLDLSSKDAKQFVASTWIVELSELASMRHADVETIKSFLALTKDKFRAPYAAGPETFLRRCVFLGTTNEGDGGYLTDRTGNRRFWPVKCGGAIDVAGLRAARAQLWAEAVAIYRSGEGCKVCEASVGRCEVHRWWFEAEHAERVERAVTSWRVVSNVMYEDAIRRWFRSLPVSRRAGPFTLLDVATEALEMDAGRMARSEEIRLGLALTRMGFDRRRIRDGVMRRYLYAPSQQLIDGPVKANPLVMLDGGKKEETT